MEEGKVVLYQLSYFRIIKFGAKRERFLVIFKLCYFCEHCTERLSGRKDNYFSEN